MRESDGRPLVEAIFSQSINGTVSTRPGESNADRLASGLTNAADQQFFRERLSLCSAVLSSYRTMSLERGAPRTGRHSGEPFWYIAVSERNRPDVETLGVSRQRGIPVAAVTFSDWATTAGHAQTDFPGSTTVSSFLATLKERGVERLGLVGGPTLFRYFLSLGCIDELSLSVCPRLGPSHPASFLADTEDFMTSQKMDLLDCRCRESTVHIRYQILPLS